MNTCEATFAEMLFACEAIKVAPANSPFLYTSGLIGPYYINTHYLCGGAERSEYILNRITELGNDSVSVAKQIPELLEETIQSFPIYAEIMKRLAVRARSIISKHNISFITGGQRRDWFFSIPLSSMLSVPHVYIYNNLSLYDDSGKPLTNLHLERSLHIADLLSVGSRYLSKWIPALESVNIKIVAALNCVDRNQGGRENLLEGGISEVEALCAIDETLFRDAYDKKILSIDQLDQILRFIKDPFLTMKTFLEGNPAFISRSLDSDEKSKERINKLLSEDLYKMGKKFTSNF